MQLLAPPLKNPRVTFGCGRDALYKGCRSLGLLMDLVCEGPSNSTNINML